MKNKKTAAFLSLLFPGFGHLYIGKYIDAIVFMVGTGVLWCVFFLRGYYLRSVEPPRYYLILAALVFVYLFSIILSYLKTNKTNNQ